MAVILSAQCTDQRVNQVTPALFRRFPTAASMASARPDELESLIRSCGLFRNKTRSLLASSQAIASELGGRVPTRREDLVRLPGVGNKTAGVVAMHLSDEPAFPVDTHVARLAFRLGLTRQRNPDAIERDLRALTPQPLWKSGHLALILHGRRVCLARAPDCLACPIALLCPRRGVRRMQADIP